MHIFLFFSLIWRLQDDVQKFYVFSKDFQMFILFDFCNIGIGWMFAHSKETYALIDFAKQQLG